MALAQRIVYPKYEYDPNGIYENENVQQWAQYYAAGGLDVAGAVYFFSVPGITGEPEQTRDAAPEITGQHIMALGAESSSSGLTRQSLPPRGPRQRVRKGVLGLLEFLQITKRGKNKAPPYLGITSTTWTEPAVWIPEADTDIGPVPWSIPPDDVEEPTPIDPPAQSFSSEDDIDASVPPSYEESVFQSEQPHDTRETSSWGTESKPSFPPSVPFGDLDDGATRRPLPTPRPPSAIWFTSEEKALFDESRTAIADEESSLIDQDAQESVPVRLSQVEASLETPSSVAIYQNLMNLLLQEVAPVDNNVTNSVLTTLSDYATSLRSFDAVTSLVKSHVYRRSLLRIASVVGLADDPRVHRALQDDEEHLADVLNNISLSASDRDAVTALENDDAQSFLNVVQDVLDRGFLLRDPEEGMKARKLLLKLSTSCYKLPQKLFIQGVRHVTQHAVFAGGYGDVFRGLYEEQKVAVKRMRIFQRECDVPSIRKKFCKEALTWQGLSHPHIVPFLGIVEEEFPDVLCMVSPWMQHGTVLMYLNSYGRHNVNKFLHEIVQGLGYLHSRHIVHGDLRGANVLVDDAGAACLSDFGLTVFNDTPATHSSRCEGAVRWMAPELYSPQQFGLERFLLTPESDIYAFACVCVELFTGNPPFIELRDPAVILRVMGGQRPARPVGSDPRMSDDLWSLVQACWAHDLALRPPVQEVSAKIQALIEVVDGDEVSFDDMSETSEFDFPPTEEDELEYIEDQDNKEIFSTAPSSPKRVRFSLPEETLLSDQIHQRTLPPIPAVQATASLDDGHLLSQLSSLRALKKLALESSTSSNDSESPPPQYTERPLGEGDLIEDYWDLMDELDNAFKPDFELSDFTTPVVLSQKKHLDLRLLVFFIVVPALVLCAAYMACCNKGAMQLYTI